ncbi:hypothetical protein O9H85_18375 [Paenibacillus filicis]|uniref:UVR domain-containing protein n=1 Tax=Paenibacillus gyeongsangnamensis TaxID=3388067 RepID=A0ABT4QBT8_9BACL|nr:hypothetical protein [Paenibacillus filicis]MCZ8514354.1 hypothetical protein [Paenibacillus filicis]
MAMACSCKKNNKRAVTGNVRLMRFIGCPNLRGCDITRRAINGAIKDLNAAKRFVNRNKFERAEDALANSLPDISKAIRLINRLERKQR